MKIRIHLIDNDFQGQNVLRIRSHTCTFIYCPFVRTSIAIQFAVLSCTQTRITHCGYYFWTMCCQSFQDNNSIRMLWQGIYVMVWKTYAIMKITNRNGSQLWRHYPGLLWPRIAVFVTIFCRFVFENPVVPRKCGLNMFKLYEQTILCSHMLLFGYTWFELHVYYV